MEDSPTGTRSAAAAGATVLVVPADVAVPDGERRVRRESLVGLTVSDLRAALSDPGGGAAGETYHRTRTTVH